MRPALILLLAGLPAWADVGPKPRQRAPGLVPRGDMAGIEIEMTSEDVTLVLKADGKRHERLVVDATFEMTNLGKATELEEGFPIGPVNNMEKFTVSLDGKAAKATAVNLGKKAEGDWPLHEGEDWWQVWQVSFAAGAKVTHAVHYELVLEHDFYTTVTTGYVLHTGAPWKNPIGRATVTLRVEGLSLAHVYRAWPDAGFERGEKELVWKREKFEPGEEDDIRIQYDDEDTWADEVARLRKEPQESWAIREELARLLVHVPFQAGRPRDDAEHADYVAALDALVREAKPKDGGFDLPDREDKVNARRYAGGGGGADALLKYLANACDALEERPEDPKARALVERYVALGEAQIAGKLTAGTYKIEFGSWEHGEGRRRLDANLRRAKELLDRK